MRHFIFIKAELIKSLEEEEFQIYCLAAFRCKRNEEAILSQSILNHFINKSNNRNVKEKIRKGVSGLVKKGMIVEVNTDVYVMNETKKEIPYFVLHYVEFEKLMQDANLLRYYSFIVSCLNNDTQSWRMANAFIQKGFGISNKTVIKYNKILVELNLIRIIAGKKIGKDCNDSNLIERVYVDEEYKSKEEKTTAEKSTAKKELIMNEHKSNDKENNNPSSSNDEALKRRIAEIMLFGECEINITSNQLKKINEVGQENFLIILKDKIKSYENITSNQGMEASEKVNLILNCVLKKDIEGGLREIEKHKKEDDDFYFVKSKTERTVFIDKRGVSDMIQDSNFQYEVVVSKLESRNMEVTEKVKDYIREKIASEIKSMSDYYDDCNSDCFESYYN